MVTGRGEWGHFWNAGSVVGAGSPGVTRLCEVTESQTHAAATSPPKRNSLGGRAGWRPKAQAAFFHGSPPWVFVMPRSSSHAAWSAWRRPRGSHPWVGLQGPPEQRFEGRQRQ